ncbi:unnamed protein product [Closterium sp. Yama58-4]|nr:unnamed protein product [Closterium sp. Yama58-4]
MSFLCPRCRLCSFETRSGLGRHMQSNACPANLVSGSDQLQAPKRARSCFIPPNPIPRAILRLEPAHSSVEPSVDADVCIAAHDMPCDDAAPHSSDTTLSTDSVDSVLPFEQDDDASSSAGASCAFDSGGAATQAGAALPAEEEAPTFNLKDALAHWILSNRLSIKHIDALLEILRKTIQEIHDWKTYRDVQAYAESKATDGHRGWRRKTIRSRNKAWLEFWHCDPLVALQDLLKHPKLAARCFMQIHNTLETYGCLAPQKQAYGKAKGHPVYLTLGNIDKDDRWQLYGHVLLALLPEFPAEYNVQDKMQVHNYIMRLVLQSLKTASYTGIAMKNAAGESINVWPYLYAYVSDYPESCKITCTKSLGTMFPCSICKVDKTHLAVLQDRIDARTPYEQDTIVRDILEGRVAPDADATLSTHPVQSFLSGWRWESDTILNPYLAVLPDVMHQADLGIFEHIVDFIRVHVKLLADRKKLDRILRYYKKNIRGGDMRLPSGQYFEKGANYQAYEHRSVMQILPFIVKGFITQEQMDALVSYIEWYLECARASEHTETTLIEFKTKAHRMLHNLKTAFPHTSDWNFIKMHLISRYIDSIRRSGLPEHYSAQLYENLHI